MSLSSDGSGDSEINWPLVFRSLKKEPYRFSKEEILDMNLRELEMYVSFTDEEIALRFDDVGRVDIYRQKLKERDESLSRSLLD